MYFQVQKFSFSSELDLEVMIQGGHVFLAFNSNTLTLHIFTLFFLFNSLPTTSALQIKKKQTQPQKKPLTETKSGC